MDQKEESLVKDSYYECINYPAASAYSAQSNLIVLSHKNQFIVLDAKNLSIIKTLKFQEPGSSYFAASLSFLKNGKHFLCWSNYAIDLWDIDSETCKTLCIRADFSSNRKVLCIDDSLALVCTKGITGKTEVNFLNIQTGEIEKTWFLNDVYNSIYVADNLLVCGVGVLQSVIQGADIYDFKLQQLVKTFKTDFPVFSAKLSHDKTYVICSGLSNSISIFNFHTGNLVNTIKVNDSSQINDFVLIKNSCYLVACDYGSFPEYKGSLIYFSFADQQCFGRVERGEFLKRIHVDEVNQSVLAVGNKGVNLVHYKTDEVPSLKNMCVKKLTHSAEFFQNHEITAKKQTVLSQYFDIEEGTENNKEKTIDSPKQS